MSRFSAKILLFGEYALLCGGEGLAIPYPDRGVIWQQSQPTVRYAPHITQSQNALLGLAQYLRSHQSNGTLPFDADLNALVRDVQRGGYCASDIPQGYGLGSSGAVTALLYDRYVRDKISISLPELTAAYAAHQSQSHWAALLAPQTHNTSLAPPTTVEWQVGANLRRHLAFIEAYFHGSSSGIDPMVSYLGCPLLLNANDVLPLPHLQTSRMSCGIVEPNTDLVRLTAALCSQPTHQAAIFLYDSGLPRQTAPLVQAFFHRLHEEPDFAALCQQELTALNRHCIAAYLAQDYASLNTAWQQLSDFQYQHFAALIPTDALRQQWKKGRQSGNYALKLCGAGGGGFVLGWAGL